MLCTAVVAQAQYTYPTWSDLAAADSEALGGTTHSRSGIKFIAKGTSPNSSPSLAAQMNNALNHTYRQLNTNLRCAKVGALAVGVAPGRYVDSAGTAKEYLGSSSSALTDNATNYIYILSSSNALTINTTGFPATWHTYVPLAQYVTSGGAISTSDEEADRRWWLVFDQHDATAASTGTDSANFTFDQDNAGAEASQQLRFNRGSTDAEDAAIEWDATNDRYNLRKQHSTSTLCPVNASALMVAGTDVIASDGDLEAASIATDQLYVFGANGATPTGVRLTLAGGAGAPGSGTHATGELHTDSAAKLYVCSAAGTPGTWQLVGNQAGIVVPSVGNGSGSAGGALTFTIQLQDAHGGNLAAAYLIRVHLMDDVDGVAYAANTSAVSATVGSVIRVVTASKDVICKTNSSGVLTLSVTNSIADNVYILVEEAPGSPSMNCVDTGTLTWS